MKRKISGQGWFLVRIEMRGTRPVAVLTGDHFGPDEIEIAKAVAGCEWSDEPFSGRSPAYLVRDSVVGVALRASSMARSGRLSGCHDGPKGRPCGHCVECKEASERMFTRAILGSIELPDTDLSERLKTAIMVVVGLPWTDAPWSGPMTDEEIDEVFEELDVQKGTEDDAHRDEERGRDRGPQEIRER